jgi:hypothetical protein
LPWLEKRSCCPNCRTDLKEWFWMKESFIFYFSFFIFMFLFIRKSYNRFHQS